MAYKLSTKKRIDLSHLGEDISGNPFFVEIKNPKMMTYDEKMQFVQFVPKQGEEFTPEIIESLKKVAGGFVLSWNLLSIGDEQPLPVPSQDEKALSKVPSDVIESIMKGMAETISKEDEATKNLSPQSVKSSENDRLQETSTSADTTN